jgi:hypothetical protein
MDPSPFVRAGTILLLASCLPAPEAERFTRLMDDNESSLASLRADPNRAHEFLRRIVSNLNDAAGLSLVRSRPGLQEAMSASASSLQLLLDSKQPIAVDRVQAECLRCHERFKE